MKLKILFLIILMFVLNNIYAQDSHYNITNSKVFVHNNKAMVRENFIIVDSKIYKRNNESNIYVNLIKLFEIFETDVKIDIKNNVIDSLNSINIQIGEEYLKFQNIIILFKDERNILIYQLKSLILVELRPVFTNNHIAYINDEYYITLELFQFLTRCSIHIDNNNDILLWRNN